MFLENVLEAGFVTSCTCGPFQEYCGEFLGWHRWRENREVYRKFCQEMLENYVLHNYENTIYIWTILVSFTKAFPTSAEPLIQHKFQAASENESPCIYNTLPPTSPSPCTNILLISITGQIEWISLSVRWLIPNQIHLGSRVLLVVPNIWILRGPQTSL